MNRKELSQRVASVMRSNDIRKPIPSQKHVFHISDDDGNTKDFVVKKSERGILFTVEDVEYMLEALIEVIEDAIRHGEPITIRGFGTLGLHYRKARSTKHPETGEPVVIPDRYIPKFTYGNNLRRCARLFELSLKDGTSYEPPQTDDEFDDMEGGE